MLGVVLELCEVPVLPELAMICVLEVEVDDFEVLREVVLCIDAGILGIALVVVIEIELLPFKVKHRPGFVAVAPCTLVIPV